jgi:excisionase family DNA binding protein
MMPPPLNDGAVMSTIGQDPLLRVEYAAQLLGLQPITVRRRIRAGELASVRLGSGPKAPVRVATSDLAAYVEHCRPAARP